VKHSGPTRAVQLKGSIFTHCSVLARLVEVNRKLTDDELTRACLDLLSKHPSLSCRRLRILLRERFGCACRTDRVYAVWRSIRSRDRESLFRGGGTFHIGPGAHTGPGADRDIGDGALRRRESGVARRGTGEGASGSLGSRDPRAQAATPAFASVACLKLRCQTLRPACEFWPSGVVGTPPDHSEPLLQHEWSRIQWRLFGGPVLARSHCWG
jgi:hypothetical protein